MEAAETDQPFINLIVKEKTSILRRWIGLVFDTYPADTAMILKSGGDRFSNPVSYNVSYNLEMILEGLICGKDQETLFSYLEDIIKIRAVQDFTPVTATSFMSLLKQAVEVEIGSRYRSQQFAEEREELEKKVDSLSDACTGIYSDCKSRIERIKVNEQRKTANNISRLQSITESVK